MSFPESNEHLVDNTCSYHELAAQKEQILKQVLTPEARSETKQYQNG